MAIGPLELIEAVAQDAGPIVDKLEPEIDKFLKARATESRSDIIWSYTNLRRNVVEEIMRRYRKAGWQVQSDRDRDSQYLRFIYPVYRADAGIHPVGARPKC